MKSRMRESRVNDFSIHVGTANGSGSQSSNQILMKSIFRMGIPVSGKNLFPSNIQGLPTWFTIRVNEDGWTARHVDHEILVCMNPVTVAEDIRKATANSFVILHDDMAIPEGRDDLIFFKVPFKKIIAEACPEVRLRKLAVNMVYVGIVAELIGIDEAAMSEALAAQFKDKKKVIDLNLSAIQAGREFARENMSDFIGVLKLKRLDKTKGKILIDGNTAAGMGAVFGGVQFMSWYPITPSSSLAEAVIHYSEKLRVRKDGSKTFAIVQAEDELAAIGMVIGASWMGGRAMTATSGPGISLMAEFVGLGYFAEIPAVIWDVQRVGPSTGLPTRTSQGDVLSAATLSHGDTKQICLYPATVSECFQFGKKALDLAEQLQTPVFVLSDLDLGMNSWMTEPFDYSAEPLHRGKVLDEKQLAEVADFGRYKDVDGDGICYRTLPGNSLPKSVYFTRGTGHNEYSGYTESEEVFEKLLLRLNRKFESAKNYLPKPVLEKTSNSEIGVIAYGSSHEAVLEALHLLKKDHSLDCDYLRVRSYPFSKELEDFIRAHSLCIVIEQNRDGQLKNLMCMEESLKAEVPKLESVLHFNGLPLPASFLVEKILQVQERCHSNRSKKRVGE